MGSHISDRSSYWIALCVGTKGYPVQRGHSHSLKLLLFGRSRCRRRFRWWSSLFWIFPSDNNPSWWKCTIHSWQKLTWEHHLKLGSFISVLSRSFLWNKSCVSLSTRPRICKAKRSRVALILTLCSNWQATKLPSHGTLLMPSSAESSSHKVLNF